MIVQEQTETEIFGGKEARWFQTAGAEAVYQGLLAGHRRIAVIQPTGSGKTITSGLIVMHDGIRQFCGVPEGQKLRVLFCSHRHRLLTQAEAVYANEEGVEIIVHMIGAPLPPDLVFDLVIIDECHHEATLSFQLNLERISVAPIVGLTATLDRNDGRLCKFSLIIELLTREEAVRQGYLAESYINTFAMAPTSSQVESVLEMIALGHEQMGQTMAFIKTKKEALAIQHASKKLGFKSEVLVDISEKQLNDKLKAFEQHEYQFAFSCMKLGEGVDVKGCESALIGRRLKSRGLLNQIIGRAARNDSDCRIWESINPLASDNLDATQIVGVPKEHHFWYKVRGEWRKHRLI